MMRRSLHVAIGAGAPSSVQVVEVEVDTLLGHVRVLRTHIGVAVGKLAQPALARSQAAGAIVQGLGYALYEGREVDPLTGDVLTTSLDDYHMPGIGDIPPIDVVLRRGRVRPRPRRQRRHRRGGDRADSGCGLKRHSQRGRRAAHPNPAPARPALGPHQPEDRGMTALTQITPSADNAEFRAAGTDLSERRRSGVSRGPLVDIVPTAETTGIAIGQTGALRIGASTTIAAIATNARIAEAYPGFAAAASGLATPQIRQLATLGGNLAQRSRCWYYRNPHFSCLKKGGARMSGARGQPPLWRRLRSRAVRRAAPLDNGDGPHGLRRESRHHQAQGADNRAIAGRRLERRRRPCARRQAK